MANVTMNNKQKFNFVKQSKRQTNVMGMTGMFKFTGTADETLTVPIACEVIDAWCVQTGAGGSGDTVTLKNGSDALTDAMDCNKSDNAVTRVGSIIDQYSTFAAGDSLFCDRASAANCDVYVLVELLD